MDGMWEANQLGHLKLQHQQVHPQLIQGYLTDLFQMAMHRQLTRPATLIRLHTILPMQVGTTLTGSQICTIPKQGITRTRLHMDRRLEATGLGQILTFRTTIMDRDREVLLLG